MLALVAVLGGAGALGVALGAAYAVQVAPAVWTAWRTPSPSGVAGGDVGDDPRRVLLWGVYGLHHGDPATSMLAVVGASPGGRC